MVWHQPHPGRCAHVAHDTASPHSCKHSPTTSAVSEQVVSTDRARHFFVAGHQAQDSSPPHAPHVVRPAQWSAHDFVHKRTPDPSLTAAVVTSVHLTVPVTLSYDPISTWSMPYPSSHRMERHAPLPGNGPSTAPSGAFAAHAHRSAAWPLVASYAKQSSVDTEFNEHDPTTVVTAGELGCSNPLVIPPALFGREAKFAMSRPAIAIPTLPPDAAPRAPLTIVRYVNPTESLTITTRDVLALPNPPKLVCVESGLKTSSPPVFVEDVHSPRPASWVAPEVGI